MAPSLASAATLTNAGGVLTYTGGAGNTNVQLSPGSGGTHDVDVLDYFNLPNTDPITSASGCTVVATDASSTEYDCPAVNSVVGTLGADDDTFDESTMSLPSRVFGEAGNDYITGSRSDDVLDGGAGDDDVYGGDGNDDVHGGTGIDRTAQFSSSDTPGFTSTTTLDDVANDNTRSSSGGVTTDYTDNVRSDVENVDQRSYGPPASGTTETPTAVNRLVGDSAANSLSVTGFSNGSIDGGAGNDVLAGGRYDDTINSVDGFADVVTCGRGNDTVTADTLDNVSDSCENVSRTSVANANQDKQPTVAWMIPVAGATLPTTSATTLSVTASDDKGVAKVQFLAGSRIVCEDSSAPYSCAYTPNGSDSGKQTLTAIAIDGAQQTASAVRSVMIARFSPRISEKISPTRDTTAPYRFRVTGTLSPPAGLSNGEACASGKISTQVKAGSKTISTRRVDIKSNCTYSSTVTFKNRKRFGKASKLKLTVRFTGNSVLAPKTLSGKTLKVR